MARNKKYDEDFKNMIVELYESHTTTGAEIEDKYKFIEESKKRYGSPKIKQMLRKKENM